MKKTSLTTAIDRALNEFSVSRIRERDIEPYIKLFADAKPSESIQKHELPGLGVGAIYVYRGSNDLLDIPIQQYKEYDRAEKAQKARDLKEWMETEREKGKLTIVGFVNALEQSAAARFGLDLIEELPNTRVEKHYKSYRLYFENEHLDFAQAVALVYYMFTVTFAISRAASKIEKRHRRYMIAILDRFPDASRGQFIPGKNAPVTQGMKFIQYLKQNANTFATIDALDEAEGIRYRPDTLEGWRHDDKEEWRDPKTHPHFTLVDWLVASAIAHSFPEEFIEEFKTSKLGRKGQNAVRTQEALVELYQEFKKHTIYEIADAKTLSMIRSGSKKEWNVPNEAKKFIYDRASR